MVQHQKSAESEPSRSPDWDFDEAALPHVDALYNTALRLTRNPQDAEDLVQETFFKAYRYYDKYQKGTNLKAWLFKILKNTFNNHYRKKQQRPPQSDFATIEDSFEDRISEDVLRKMKNPEEQFLEDVLDQDIQAALDALPENYRMAVVLADLEDFSYKEIAEILEVPVGTVMSRLYRGRKRLEATMLEYAREHGYLRERTPSKSRADKEPNQE